MTLKPLNENQLARLDEYFSDFLTNSVWEQSGTEKGEVVFTGTQVLHQAEKWLQSLNRKTLVLRSDGMALQPLPLTYLGATFRPDLEIVEYETRLIALEVKFIKQNDPSGSIAKAIGQSLLYKTAGSTLSYALLIDLRKSESGLQPGEFEHIVTEAGIKVHRVRPV